MSKLNLMDVTIRDGQQSLWATRMTTADMLPILPAMDRVGYWAVEAWGGATFDTCVRFLDEDPWERLRVIKANMPNTPLSMLSRGQNLVGYKHYSKEVVHRFILAAHRNGIDIFRVFDALNDIRNIEDNAIAIKECGAHFQGAISYTVSPVHTLDNYLEYAQKLKDLEADSIVIKDMAGLLTPFRGETLINALNKEIGLPVHLHCHYAGGMAVANIMKACEAGVAIADTASAPLAFGNSHSPVEMVVAALQGSEYDTELDLPLLFEIAEYWDEVRKRNNQNIGVSSVIHMQVFSHQVPGGMMSNLVSQLEGQKASDRLPEVMKEIPKVRAEVGYPPLVTPMSQIVGTQAVFNVLTGKRWSVVSKEMKDYLCGYYGKAPGPIDEEFRAKAVGKAKILPPDVSPCSLETVTFDELAAEIGDLAESEEDVLTYAMFPIEGRAYLEKHRGPNRVEDSIASKTKIIIEEEDRLAREEADVDTARIRDLLQAAEANGAAEIIVEEEGSRVVVRMPAAFQGAYSGGPVPFGFPPMQPMYAPGQAAYPALGGYASAPAPVPAPAPAAPPEEAQAPAEQKRPDNWVCVASPMVGTFYCAPSPGEPPFVKEGDTIEEGQTLCIIEAMKLMNEIEAEEGGVIREVCLDDATPVEFGTPLFYVEVS